MPIYLILNTLLTRRYSPYNFLYAGVLASKFFVLFNYLINGNQRSYLQIGIICIFLDIHRKIIPKRFFLNTFGVLNPKCNTPDYETMNKTARTTFLALLFMLLANQMFAKNKIVEVWMEYDTAAVLRMDRYISFSIVAKRENGKIVNTPGYRDRGSLGHFRVPVSSRYASRTGFRFLEIDWKAAIRDGKDVQILISVPENPAANKTVCVPIPRLVSAEILCDSLAALKYGTYLGLNFAVKLSNGQILTKDFSQYVRIRATNAKYSNGNLSIDLLNSHDPARIELVTVGKDSVVATKTIPITSEGTLSFTFDGTSGQTGGRGSDGRSAGNTANGERGTAGQGGGHGSHSNNVYVSVTHPEGKDSSVFEVKIESNRVENKFLFTFGESSKITINCRGGQGGSGGKGGTGGAGLDGEEPGYGGNGGAGGMGGDGGNGGDVSLSVPEGCKWIANHFSVDNSGGMGGYGGSGGNSGRGGYESGDTLLGRLFTGRSGESGTGGQSGRQGMNGRPMTVETR